MRYDSKNWSKCLGKLKEDDMVFFEKEIKNKVVIYQGEVWSDFIASKNHPNNRHIFQTLGLDAEEVCKATYGYRPGDGDWPVASGVKGNKPQEEIMAALTRVCIYLWAEIKRRKKDSVPPFKKDQLINPKANPDLKDVEKFMKASKKNDTKLMRESFSWLLGFEVK